MSVHRPWPQARACERCEYPINKTNISHDYTLRFRAYMVIIHFECGISLGLENQLRISQHDGMVMELFEISPAGVTVLCLHIAMMPIRGLDGMLGKRGKVQKNP
jgi:hypothetical protein